jgi:uncharacterized protein YcbK (DUF882 family)
LFVRPSNSSLRSFRVFSVLLFVVLMGIAVPSASARTRPARRHTKLRSLAYALVNVPLPGAGMLPESEADLPEDGLKYELKLIRSHTGDAIDVVYRVGDVYMPGALMELNDFLRDSHNREMSFIEPRTFDLLHTMLAKLGKSDSPIDILSGFRSLDTNTALRESGTSNAAEHSQHIEGTAIDLRVPGVPALAVRDAAKSLAVGGVGYYPSGQFVHVDAGPVREWTYSGRAARVRKHGHARRARQRRRA